ncbi:MAG: TonB-dependent receptor [Bacteroidota bacterium]
MKKESTSSLNRYLIGKGRMISMSLLSLALFMSSSFLPVTAALKNYSNLLAITPAINVVPGEKLSKADIPVKGKITDQKTGEALIGVSVKVKGTNIGVSTDVNGNYSLEAPENGTLVITYVGYDTREELVNNRGTINVSLVGSSTSLSEVVVVGYGTQKKETVTGSVVTVKGDELRQSPTINLSNSLAGRLPGVTATQASGEPGFDGSVITIRGSNTLGNTGALIVIDGVPALSGGLDRINPADVASMSILKDAAAAIYGSRAANGVILITTKRGKSGKPSLNYTFDQSFSQPTRIPKVLNSAQYTELINELDVYNLPTDEWAAGLAAFKATGSYKRLNGTTANASYSPGDIQKFKDGSDPWRFPNTDWFDATLKTWSPQQRHNLQLTGGSENVRYLSSLGYLNQDGYYVNSATGFKQFDMRVNVDATVNKYINTSIGILARQENRNFPTTSAAQIFRMLMRSSPTAQAYWPNGLPGPDIENGTQPVVVTTDVTGYNRDTRYFYQTNGKLEISNPWVEGLKFTGTAALDKRIRAVKNWQYPWFLYSWNGTSLEADGKTPMLTKGRRGPPDPSLFQSNEDDLGVVLGALVSYDKNIGDHTLNLLAGTTSETSSGNNFNARRRYFISTSIDQMFAGGDLEKNNGGGAFERARLGYLSRIAYNYKEKYMVELLGRYDASHIFAEDSRYGFFPGVMAAWKISEENFWKNNVPFVESLKLRGSWGQLGNDAVGSAGEGEFQYLSTYGFGTYIAGGQEVKTLSETRVPNTALTWEVANNSNLGLDGSMLNGRINFEFDVFYNLRTNILWARNGSVPQTTGMILPRENIGEVENKGFEFLVGYNSVGSALKYNFSLNGGYAVNKVLFFDENPGLPEWQRTTGGPMQTGLFYQYDGIFKDAADVAANKLDYKGAGVNVLRPGDMKYKDINGDGKINTEDRLRDDLNGNPRFQGGANLSLQYKTFDLSVLFQGALGAQQNIGTESGRIGNYLLHTYENRWTPENLSSVNPRITDRGNQYYSGGNTYWIRSSDYLRLKNVELGFNLPAAFSKRAGVSNFRIYARGLNLLTWDKMKIYDPETTNGGGQYYPQSRIISTGVSATF